MSLDHSDEPGFPAEPTKVVRRRNVPPSLWAQRRSVSNAKIPVAEHGWLTPIRKCQGDPQFWFWRCRCGDETTFRRAADVRKGLKRGSVPKCTACDLAERRKARAAARAERRGEP